MRRLQIWTQTHWTTAAAIMTLALIGVATTGCGGEEEEEGPPPCESVEDCSDGELCQEDVCIEPEGDVDCDVAEDCPKGMICMGGDVCVDNEAEISCSGNGDCPTGRLCEDEVCEIDPLGPLADPVAIQNESYQTSFYAEGRIESSNDELRIVSRSGGGSEVIDTGDIDCEAARNCAVSEDMTHLIVADTAASGDGYDLAAAPLGGDPLAVESDATVFAESVLSPRIRGNGAVFEREVESVYVGYFQEYDGAEMEVAELHTAGTTLQRAWDVDPTSGRAVLFYPPDLIRLYTHVGTIEDGVTDSADDRVVLFEQDNLPSPVGSIYIGGTPAGFSADGRLIAFATKGPNNYESCDPDGADSQCSLSSHECGSEGRCVGVEPTINVIDMEYADNIDEPCTSHDACGPVHRCDSGSEHFDGGTCQPQRIVAGLGPASQGGCQDMRDNDHDGFTDIVAPLTFGADGNVYFVGKRDCVRSAADPETDGEANIPRTSVVAGNVRTGEYEEVFGNLDGADFNGNDCWDNDSGQLTNTNNCNIFIENARVSPDGDDIVFTATNPSIGSVSLASTTMDVYRVQRDGSSPQVLGEVSGAHNAGEISVHAD